MGKWGLGSKRSWFNLFTLYCDMHCAAVFGVKLFVGAFGLRTWIVGSTNLSVWSVYKCLMSCSNLHSTYGYWVCFGTGSDHLLNSQEALCCLNYTICSLFSVTSSMQHRSHNFITAKARTMSCTIFVRQIKFVCFL